MSDWSEFEKRALQSIREICICLPEFAQQLYCCHTEGSPEFGRRQRRHQRVLEPHRHLRRQTIYPLGVDRGQAESKAGQRQRIVPDGADPVLGLPQFVPFNADPSMQNVVPGQPDGVVSVYRRRGRALDRLTENYLEGGPESAKLGGGCTCQIHLKAGGKKEGAIDGAPGPEIKMMQGAQLLVHEGAPIAQGVVRRGFVRDSEEEVDIRPSVLGAACSGASYRCPYDVPIRVCPVEQPCPYPVPVILGEHCLHSQPAQPPRRLLLGLRSIESSACLFPLHRVPPALLEGYSCPVRLVQRQTEL